MQERLYKYLFPVIAIALTLGAGGVLRYLAHELEQRTIMNATEDARAFAVSVTQFRNFYSAEIVPRARDSGMQITHAYRHIPNALPLPATFTLDFGEYLTGQREDVAVELYSALPFPWRAAERQLDAFQREAIEVLALHPDKPFIRTETIDGVQVLRYAVADRLKESCVACHNTYPGTPKTDWSAGDVRGVLEVRRSLAAAHQHLNKGLEHAAYFSGALILLTLTMLWLALRGLRNMLRVSNETNRQLNETKQALENQIFALDQHAIVSVTDRNGTITYANDKFAAISGYTREELIGANHRLVNSGLHPREFFTHLWQTITSGEVWSGEIRNRRKDGSYYWVSATIVPFLDENGKPYQYIGIRTDITQRKTFEEQALIARDAAQAANRAKSDFLANMSHEIRTPMNGIIGMTDLAIDASSDEERQECLTVIKSSAQSLLGIINDILDFSKIEAGKLSIERIDFDLRHTVTDCLRSISSRASEKGIELVCDIDDEVPDSVRGDPTRLRQILLNLVGNAIKFTERGEIVVRIKQLAANERATHLLFSVKDTGIGIPPDKLSSIFEAFTQADTSITRRFGGTGLGLTITQRLLDLMGGHMEVESTPGKGSTFSFTLPMGIPDKAYATSEAIAPKGDIPPAQRNTPLSILLVEDNPVNQKLATRILEKWGHTVTLAHNGSDALDLVASNKAFDLALMDLHMPVMGGIEATQRIRRLEAENNLPRLRIVAMTASAMPSDRKACLDAGMDDYLAKPIVFDELAAKLGQAPARAGGTPPAGFAVPPAPTFDYAAAVQAMDPEMIEILTPAFLEHYPDELEALRAALSTGDASESLRRAHGLKGTLAAFGAEPARTCAAEIEALAKAGDLETASRLYTHLVDHIGQLVKVLRH